MIARTGATAEPLLMNVFMARRVNAILGGAVVGPWDIDQIPDDVLQSILSIERVGEVRAGLRKVEDIFGQWRNKYARKQH